MVLLLELLYEATLVDVSVYSQADADVPTGLRPSFFYLEEAVKAHGYLIL